MQPLALSASVNVPYHTRVKNTLCAIPNFLYKLARKVVEAAISKFFYFGYKVLPENIQRERANALLGKGAYLLPCRNNRQDPIDLYYIPSSSTLRTGNVIVLALNTTPFDHHPKHYEHYLKNGADVVLWKQTARYSTQYAQDLLSVIKSLKVHKPDQKIAIKAYCAGVDPSISVAAELKDPNLLLLLDRGQGNAQRLAESQSILAKTSLVRSVVREKFSCEGINKIGAVPGRIAFTAPPAKDDQCMHYARGKKNFNWDLKEARQKAGRKDDAFIVLEGGDHWTRWPASVHNKIYKFLSENEIIAPHYTPATDHLFPPPKPPTFWSRKIMPLLIKSSWDCFG